jgi:hypothetical protein
VRGDGDGHLRAADRLVERQRHRRLEVAPALGGRLGARPAPGAAGRAAEEVRQDVAEAAEVRPARAAATGERAAGAEHRAAPVVLPPLLLVGQDVIGLRDRLEALLGPGLLVGVRVMAARELAVGLLDVVLGGLLVDAQDLVVVRTRGHQALTTTRAGRRTEPLIR